MSVQNTAQQRQKSLGDSWKVGAHYFLTGVVREKTREGNCWTCCLGMEKDLWGCDGWRSLLPSYFFGSWGSKEGGHQNHYLGAIESKKARRSSRGKS